MERTKRAIHLLNMVIQVDRSSRRHLGVQAGVVKRAESSRTSESLYSGSRPTLGEYDT